MGPPPFGERNVAHVPGRLRRASGFNGAAAFRRAESSGPEPGAATSCPLQWGRRLSASGIPRQLGRSRMLLRRFNGAAAFRRAELSAVALVSVVVTLASMGPPPFGERNIQA